MRNMYMNILDAFFNPRQLVRDSLDNPNVNIVIGLILLMPILSTFLSITLGLGFNVMVFAFSIIDSILTVLVLSGLYYLFFFFTNQRKKVSGKFLGILQSNSTIYIYLAITSLIVLLIFVFTPSLAQPIQDRGKGIITDTEFEESLANSVERINPTLANFMVLLVGIGFLVMTIYQFYLWFLTLNQITHFGFLRTFVIYIALMIVFIGVMYTKSIVF